MANTENVTQEITEALLPPILTGTDKSEPALTLPNGKPVRPWIVLLSVIFGFFMSLLDATIITIALTNIQTNLKTDLTTVSWAINIYTLTFAALLVTMGRLADQFGRKRVFMIGMVIFSFGSLLCAFAPSIEFLIGFRVIQALGASVVEAVSLAIILGVFPKEKRTAAIGIWGALAGLAAAAGPVIGGFLLELGKGNLEWRWIFFVNLPFCLIGLVMIARNVPEIRDAKAGRNIDFGGVITLSIGVFCLALGFTQANDWGWTSWGVIGFFATSLVSLVLFYIVETHQAQPILEFSLFRVRSFTAACMVGIMFTLAFMGVTVILIQYFITSEGKSPLEAALAFIWTPLAAFVVAGGSSSVGDKFSPRLLVIIGMAMLGLGLLSLYTLPVDASFIDLFWREIVLGIGTGLCFTSLPNIALSGVPRNKLGAGSGAYNTFQQLGFALGVAILISLLSGQFKTNLPAAQTRAIAAINAAPNLPSQAKEGIINSLKNSNTQSAGSNAPAGQPNNPLTQQIEAEFKRGTLDSFTFTWFAAAMFALFGIIPALFTSAAKAQVAAHGVEEDFEPKTATAA